MLLRRSLAATFSVALTSLSLGLVALALVHAPAGDAPPAMRAVMFSTDCAQAVPTPAPDANSRAVHAAPARETAKAGMAWSEEGDESPSLVQLPVRRTVTSVAPPPGGGQVESTAPLAHQSSGLVVPRGAVAEPQPLASAGGNDYASQVARWLERHKHFPPALARQDGDATVLVGFQLDRHVRTRQIELVASSGIGWLDRVAMRQVRDTSPFPRPPRGMEESELRFQVPTRYRARQPG